MIIEATRRDTLPTFSIDAIYGTGASTEEENGGSNCIDHDGDDYNDYNLAITANNPLHSGANVMPSSNFRSYYNREESPQLPQVPSNDINISTLDADDTALYEEFKNLQSSHDESVYEMADETEVALTFDEWKRRGKQFKKGTRGSFVKAFQVFEEREQLMGSIPIQSSSVQNTMHLYKSNTKNILAAKAGVLNRSRDMSRK